MISLIIPSYRNPEYLDLCLKSAVDGRASAPGASEIICVLDGFVEESEHLIEKYQDTVAFLKFEQNYGMQTALNYGVYNASHENILIINDDNVLCTGWDTLSHWVTEKEVITINQIEPTGPGIFNFPVKDFGKTPEEFKFKEFDDYAAELNTPDEDQDKWFTPDGGIFPFMMKKKDYMASGGFDTIYQSPFICDWDFFLKLELAGCSFRRTNLLHYYHFGSAATKNRTDGDKIKFKASEQPAAELYNYKWGHAPRIYENNSHAPKGQTIRGITY